MGPAGFELDLRDLLDSLPVMIAVIDREHRYVFVNRPYEALHGCKRDEIEGRPLREKLGEAGYQGIRAQVERALSGERVSFDARVPHRDGGTRFVQAVYVPDVAPEGSVRGFFALVTDITERKAVEEALRESEGRFRAMADTSPVFIATLDLHGRIEFLNRAWLEFRGSMARSIMSTRTNLRSRARSSTGKDFLMRGSPLR